MINYNYFFFILVIMFSSTKAQVPIIENKELTELSVKELLMQNNWVLISMIMKSNTWDPFALENDSITFTQVLDKGEYCWEDDIHMFKKDSIYIRDDSFMKCGNYDKYITTWHIEDSNLLRTRTTYLNGQFVMSSIVPIIEINSVSFTEYSSSIGIESGDRSVTICKYGKK